MESSQSREIIIRVKRKRDQLADPISELVIELPQSKREKIAELADAMAGASVSENRSPASPTTPDTNKLLHVFRFVSTVSAQEAKSRENPREILERIAELRQSRKLPEPIKSPEEKLAKSIDRFKTASRNLRFAQVKQHRELKPSASGAPAQPTTPLSDESVPMTTADATTAVEDPLRFLDLVACDDTAAASKKPVRKTKRDKELEDEIVCNYMPMIREYLDRERQLEQAKQAHATSPAPPPHIASTANGGEASSSGGPGEEGEDGYVYDLYYMDPDAIPQLLENIPVVKIESFGEDLVFGNEYDSESYSDEEDSNASSNPANSYPDEEQSGSERDSWDSSAEESNSTDDSEDMYAQPKREKWSKFAYDSDRSEDEEF